MTNPAPLDYTGEEIRSYLPTGWTLVEETPGSVESTWEPKKRIWRTRIEDTADMPWELEIRGDDVDKEGRIPALKRAMKRLFVGRLGRRTKGFGF